MGPDEPRVPPQVTCALALVRINSADQVFVQVCSFFSLSYCDPAAATVTVALFLFEVSLQHILLHHSLCVEK
jgi:hypothetical protein